MDKDTRARIAFAVGRVVAATTKAGIFDHSERRHRILSGACSRDAIHVYDHHSATHLDGPGDGVNFRLYDHGRGAHLSLKLIGNSFSGEDHGSGHTFSGITHGTAIQLFDHGDGSWSHYTA
jgi:hypothetical protein